MSQYGVVTGCHNLTITARAKFILLQGTLYKQTEIQAHPALLAKQLSLQISFLKAGRAEYIPGRKGGEEILDVNGFAYKNRKIKNGGTCL